VPTTAPLSKIVQQQSQIEQCHVFNLVKRGTEISVMPGMTIVQCI
jgi:hypothetical protein